MLTPITEGVYVHQSASIATNTVVVEGRAGMLLVDPGLTGAELECLAGDLRERGRTVVAGFSTHPHWDHVLWHAGFGEAPRYGTALCAESLRNLLARDDWQARVAERLPPDIAGHVPMTLLGQVTGLPVEATRIPWDGPDIRIIEHRAHAPGHAALLLEAAGVLIAGDMLSDVLIPVLNLMAEDPIEDYLAALRAIERLAGKVDVVVPGHGAVGGEGQLRTRLDLDRAYLLALRDHVDIVDPRLGALAKPGWEWVSELHAGQLHHLRS